jgi:hypothetical protein
MRERRKHRRFQQWNKEKEPRPPVQAQEITL